jgi:hypothetical protein
VLEPWQARKVRESLGPTMRYLGRLRLRMDKTGRHEGKLYDLVRKAEMAVFDLSLELHYMSCEHGVHRQREK